MAERAVITRLEKPEKAGFLMLPASMYTLFRGSQYTRKADWNHVALEHVAAFCRGAVSGRAFDSGRQGIWIRPVFDDAEGGQWCWLLLCRRHRVDLVRSCECRVD